jgi:hypothetical protein
MLVIIDQYTIYKVYIPITKTLDTVSLSNVYIRDYFKRFGLPKIIDLIEINISSLTIWNNLHQSLKLS